MITNSAVRAHADSFRRRSSAGAPRASLIRQVERICDEDEPSAAGDESSDGSSLSSDDEDGSPELRARPSLAGSEKAPDNNALLKSQRRRQRRPSRNVRYSIAKRIKARQEDDEASEPESVVGEAPPWRASTSERAEAAGPVRTSNSQLSEASQSASEKLPSSGLSKRPRRSRKSGVYVDVKIDRPWFILLPHGKVRMGWDIFMAWLLAFMAFYIPYRVCLYWDDDSPTNAGVFWFELVADVTFGTDIVLNFLTAYQDKRSKSVVTAPKLIAIRYLKGFFLLDLVATFPFSYVLTNSSIGIANKVGKLGRLPKMIRFLRAIRLLKLLRVYKLQQFVMKLEVEYNIHHGISRMLNIVTLVMLVTHFVGCFWYLVGLFGGDDPVDGGWMYRFDFDGRSTAAKYVASLYWAFSTLTTVGYGDISARTPGEQMYSMAMMLLGVSWYAYVVSSMSSIMSTFDAQNKAVRDKLVCVNEFVRAARLPPSIAKKVRGYFEHKLANSQRAFLMNKHYDADELLEELSSGLRADVLLFMERDLVEKIPFFENKVPQFVADTISMFQPMVFQEGDFIVKERTQADEMFFLTKGRAAVYYGDRKHAEVQEGGYFGEIGCIMGGIRRAGVKALATCELQALSRRNLNILLGEYPDVAEELKSVAKFRAKVVRKENNAGGAGAGGGADGGRRSTVGASRREESSSPSGGDEGGDNGRGESGGEGGNGANKVVQGPPHTEMVRGTDAAPGDVAGDGRALRGAKGEERRFEEAKDAAGGGSASPTAAGEQLNGPQQAKEDRRESDEGGKGSSATAEPAPQHEATGANARDGDAGRRKGEPCPCAGGPDERGMDLHICDAAGSLERKMEQHARRTLDMFLAREGRRVS